MRTFQRAPFVVFCLVAVLCGGITLGRLEAPVAVVPSMEARATTTQAPSGEGSQEESVTPEPQRSVRDLQPGRTIVPVGSTAQRSSSPGEGAASTVPVPDDVVLGLDDDLLRPDEAAPSTGTSGSPAPAAPGPAPSDGAGTSGSGGSGSTSGSGGSGGTTGSGGGETSDPPGSGTTADSDYAPLPTPPLPTPTQTPTPSEDPSSPASDPTPSLNPEPTSAPQPVVPQPSPESTPSAPQPVVPQAPAPEPAGAAEVPVPPDELGQA